MLRLGNGWSIAWSASALSSGESADSLTDSTVPGDAMTLSLACGDFPATTDGMELEVVPGDSGYTRYTPKTFGFVVNWCRCRVGGGGRAMSGGGSSGMMSASRITGRRSINRAGVLVALAERKGRPETLVVDAVVI